MQANLGVIAMWIGCMLGGCGSAVAPDDASDARAGDAHDGMDGPSSGDGFTDVAPDLAPIDEDGGTFACGTSTCTADQVCVVEILSDEPTPAGYRECGRRCADAPSSPLATWTCDDFTDYCRLGCHGVRDRALYCECE